MTTATGLTCVDYLSPKFNIHTFQDSDYNINKQNLYEYDFKHISTYLNERNNFNNRSVGNNSSSKGLNFNTTQQSCLQELRCNFTKLNLAEKFMQSCGRYTTALPPKKDTDVAPCGGTTAGTAAENNETILRSDKLSCENTTRIFTNPITREDRKFCTPTKFGTPSSIYSHKCKNKLHESDSDSCDTDDDEIVGYTFDTKNTDPLSSRDFNFSTYRSEQPMKEFRVINDENVRPDSELTDDEYSDSEIELAMINKGVFQTTNPIKNSRKRSSDCLQESDVKRPCIDVEKMHLSLSNNRSSSRHLNDKRLFVPINVNL